MPDDDPRNRLRIGGWLPPYPEDPEYLGEHQNRSHTNLVPYRGSPLVPVGPEPRTRRVVLVCAAAALAGAAGMLALVYPAHRNDQEPTLAERMVFPTPAEPSAPVSLLPSPTTTTAGPTRPGGIVKPGDGRGVPNTTPVSTALPSSRPGPTGATQPVTPAPVVKLVAGSTVGLELANSPGYRVRHRNFVGRVDQLSSSSSAGDRADSRFVVRHGLGRSDCFSLEAVNYPGYYLRHRNYILRLDRRDGSRLFEQDATFCTALTADNRALTLRSINYPDRALQLEGDNMIHLDRGTGTAFTVKSPL